MTEARNRIKWLWKSAYSTWLLKHLKHS